MLARHVAYGLDLRCSFELPGMCADAATGLPIVRLERVSESHLERSWSGASGQYSWTGTLGDGRTLAIETGHRGDLRFSYGDRARFLLDADGELLRCAPSSNGLEWQHILLTRVLPDVAIARGYEALHASALASPEGVVAILAPSGTGKTTLAVELLRRGWPLLADDVLVLGAGDASAGVLAYPAAPVMNIAPSVPELSGLGETLAVFAGERWVAITSSTRTPLPLRMIFLLRRSPDLTLEALALPASPLPLAPYMLGLDDDAERERHRFALYADLMSATSLIRLTADLDTPPTQLADLVEEALAERSPLAAGTSR